MALRPALRLLVLLLPVLALAPGPARAQLPFTLTLSGGGTLPVASFSGDGSAASGAEAAGSFGLQFTLRSRPLRSLYAGFSQHRFECGEAGCPARGTLVSTLWDLGARFHLTPTGLSPWLQVGAVFGRVEGGAPSPGTGTTGTVPAPERAVSDLSVGGEVGAGLEVMLNESFALRPAVRYTLMDTRFPDGLLRMRYLVVDLGLMVGF